MRKSRSRPVPDTTAANQDPLPIGGTAATGFALVAAVLAVLCAKPIVDSDLWFHLAYGRQMATSQTLVLDHTAFSWTPSDNVVIYCAWITQLALYWLHDLGGLPALFVLRYVVFVYVFGSCLWYAHRRQVLGQPLVALLAMLALLMSSGAYFIKPQLASFAGMAVIATVCAWVRHGGGDAKTQVFALPLVMSIWVNSHGGFVVGLLYLFVVAAGELLNSRLSPAVALTSALRRRLLLAVGLSFAAVLLTPYGIRYPLQFLTLSLPTIDLAAVRDYDSIFAAAQRPLHYVEFGALAVVMIFALSIDRLKKGTTEWGLVLANVVLAVLYAYYVRLTFFWAPVLLVTGITLLADRPRWLAPAGAGRARAFGAVVLAVTTLIGGYAVRSDLNTPVIGSWSGFGNGYWNPEEEAEFIAQQFPEARLGNDYNAGGYLIWKLGPRSRVFMDARYFPYRSWFQEYLALESTSGIDALLVKYSADVWCIDLLLPRTVSWFRSSPDWVPAFYGSSAAVFVRRGTPIPVGGLRAGAKVGTIRNLYQALLVFAFALDVNDLDGAEQVVQGIEGRFRSGSDRTVVAGARAALDGVRAHHRGDYAAALTLLKDVAAAYQGRPAAAMSDSASHEAIRLWQSGDARGALQMATTAVRFAPQSLVARHNAGAIGWWLQRETSISPDKSWRVHLETFVQLAERGRPASASMIEAARSMLAGQGVMRPTLLAPAPE